MGSDACKFEPRLNKVNRDFPVRHFWPHLPPLRQLLSETFGRVVLCLGPWVEESCHRDVGQQLHTHFPTVSLMYSGTFLEAYLYPALRLTLTPENKLINEETAMWGLERNETRSSGLTRDYSHTCGVPGSR